MTDKYDDHTTHRHFYVTPDVLPKPDDSDTEWIQRVSMLAEMGEQLMRHAYTFLRINAPILVGSDQLTFHLMAGVGLLLRGIATTGERQLAKAGLKPLDVDEDQTRTVRDELAKPNLPPELRDALLTILAHNLEESGKRTPEPADDEWPEEIVIGGGDSGT